MNTPEQGEGAVPPDPAMRSLEARAPLGLTLWRRRLELPLIVAAVLYLVAYSIQVTSRPDPALNRLLEGIIWAMWGLFLVEYLVNLVLAPSRSRWFFRHLHELVILLLPMLRPLRLLRLIPLLRILNRSGGDALRGHIVLYVISAMTVLGYAGALAVLDVEQEAPNANILSLPDALWWALTTVTSVGYGDYYPVTGAGRFVAAGLMIGGIGVLSAVTAAFASWLVENVGTARAEARAADADNQMQDQLRSVSLQIDTLTRQLTHGSHPKHDPRHDPMD